MKPRVLILHANGTNRDQSVAYAFNLAGAEAEIVHLNQLRDKNKKWNDYQILVIAGGFANADVLGAGQLLALELNSFFMEEMQQFIASGKPVLGICNGFQTLVKGGFLPGLIARQRQATLTYNAQGKFECRWVTLISQSKNCLWTRDLVEPIYCPVAHGEGRFVLKDPQLLNHLKSQQQIALCYADPEHQQIEAEYPFNPNGSIANIAGVCNPQGNVLGLMPHPEDHVLPHQHPRWTRGERGWLGLPLFINAIKSV